MSVQLVLARIAEIQGVSAAPPAPAPQQAPATSFSAALAQAQAAPPSAVGQRIVGLVRGEVGVAETSTNDSPRIAEYRRAMPNAPGVGPWCAYFASWAAAQAGVPLGDSGQGFARVDDVAAWAQRTGRWNSQPQPGDLIIWDEHMGIVESVGPDGSVQTIEGNSGDAVTRRTHAAGSALGYVRLG